MTLHQLLPRMTPYWSVNKPGECFDEIEMVESHLGSPLPADYKYFLQWFSNGGEGGLPGGYLLLFRIEEVIVRQRDYQIATASPGHLAIGLEGDHIFCFRVSERRSTADYRVVEIPLSCLDDPEEVVVVGENFADFLSRRLGA